MAFENLTLFELHLENSRFGPSFGSEEEVTDGEDQPASDDGEGGRGMARPLGVLLLVVALAFAVRRYRSSGESIEDVDGDDSEGITIEHATEQ